MGAFHYIQADELLDRITADKILELALEGASAKDADETTLTNAFAEVEGTLVGGASVLEAQLAGRITAAVEFAEGRVNSRVGKSYPVPAVASDGTVPPEVRDAVLALAANKLYERRDRKPQGVEMAYEQAEEWLREVARGRAIIALLDATGQEEARKQRIITGTTNRDNVLFAQWL